MALEPFHIPGIDAGRVPLAADKSDYNMVFYHGDNLEDGFSTTGDNATIFTETDNFAVQGTVVRLPRVVMAYMTHSTFDAETSEYYLGVFDRLSSAYASSGICFAWGKGGANSPLSFRWLRDVTPGVEVPNPYSSSPTTVVEQFSHEDMIAGDILVFIFMRENTLAYGTTSGEYEEPFFTTAERYQEDYERFTGRHERFQSFKGIIYEEPPSADFTTENMIAGDNVFAQFGKGLGEYGWEWNEHELNNTAPQVAQSIIATAINDFFELDVPVTL